ncbi:hypothetical protein UA08_07188 [Talaromyces atroroseus]|uniref:Oxidoreductase n=1 Tax=Talaromyces atroroseus TaxID=1441469 RepID=A0A225A9K0_TALAT|nr:hypothetical protein UA08_07188 [Talaromyces atroroseus]OKL57432.1 hypothetical protein UA08_07188 [Talaromyces atroroseus]
MVLDGPSSTSLEPSKDTETWDSPDLESRYASAFPLKINREHLQRPNPLLLYAGFAGPWNWERTVMYRISTQLEMVRGLLRRDPTQTELDAMVEHTSREANTRRIGLPLGLTAGSAHAYYTLRKQLKIPATTSLVEGVQTAWRQAPAADRRQAVFQCGLRFGMWVVFTLGNFAALASYRFTVALSTDPRLVEFREAIRKYAEARMQRLEGYREKTRQRREERDTARHATASAEEQPSSSSSSEVTYGQAQTVYDNSHRQWQTQIPSDISSSSSSSQDFFDDASPTAPEFQKSQALSSSLSNENAWERVRRENASRPRSSASAWRQQTSPAAQSSQSLSEGNIQYSDIQIFRYTEQTPQRNATHMTPSAASLGQYPIMPPVYKVDTSSNMSATKVFAIVAGVGPGTVIFYIQGSSIARKFAQSYPVVVLARNPENYNGVVNEINTSGGQAIGISTDISDAKSVSSAFQKITTELFPDTPLAAAIFNPGGGFVKKPFLELTEEEFSSAYNVQTKGAFLFSQAVLPLLLKGVGNEFPPSLIFTGRRDNREITGATASIRGSATFAPFAASKFGLRALSQSLAREFGPQGVHVAHIIVDGVIDIPRTKHWKNEVEDAKLSPEAIADSYWFLHTQPRTTFAFELDLRPYVEKW